MSLVFIYPQNCRLQKKFVQAAFHDWNSECGCKLKELCLEMHKGYTDKLGRDFLNTNDATTKD